MKRLGLVVAPIFFAVRRVRARPLSFATLVLAFAGAGALIGWSSLTAALAQEKAVRIRLETLPPGARSFRVVYFMLPQEADYRAGTVAEALAGLAGVTERTRRIRIWHSIEPGRSLGTRLVVAREAAADVAVRAGRLPAGCRGRVCEA